LNVTQGGDHFSVGSEAKTRGTTFKPGRWPANLIHDGSEEVLAGFPVTESGSRSAGQYGGMGYHGSGDWPMPEINGDSGSAARFFYQVKPDHRCELCCVNFAAPPSPIESIQTGASVHSDAAGTQAQESAAKGSRKKSPARFAARDSRQCHQPNGASVPSNAEPWPLERIVHNVLSAASLCLSCGTDIARAIVGVRQGVPLDTSLTTLSIATYKKTILSRSLANHVARRESTDTILTIPSLTILFGSVFHAIGEHINSERVGSVENTKPALSRYWYTSKADADDRLGSKHPTVKPIDLIQYLVRLITPLGGCVLDPFAGTGTTAEAAWREGMRCIVIEREEEYQSDIVKRMGLCLAGPDERRAKSVKQEGIEDTPLFGPEKDTTKRPLNAAY